MKSVLKWSKLSVFQRIMLKTDGTLTEILEAYLAEPIQMQKIAEDLYTCQNDMPALQIQAGQNVLDRKILLQGQHSQTNWVYAHSLLVPDRLRADFWQELRESQQPIGRLWLKYKTETYREFIASHSQTAGDLAQYFGLSAQSILYSRTYRVYCQGLPVIMITEKFPAHYFCP
jgi:chorismate-pyruvate lyase